MKDMNIETIKSVYFIGAGGIGMSALIRYFLSKGKTVAGYDLSLIHIYKTVENYLKAKKKFFDELPKGAFSLTNLDDKNGLVMTQNTRCLLYTSRCV